MKWTTSEDVGCERLHGLLGVESGDSDGDLTLHVMCACPASHSFQGSDNYGDGITTSEDQVGHLEQWHDSNLAFLQEPLNNHAHATVVFLLCRVLIFLFTSLTSSIIFI